MTGRYVIDRTTLEQRRTDARKARDKAQEAVVALTRRLDPTQAHIEEAEYWRMVALERWKDTPRDQARRRAALERDAKTMHGHTPRRGHTHQEEV